MAETRSILLIAREAEARRSLRALLGSGFEVCDFEPSGSRPLASSVDAAAAVAVLSGAPHEIEHLERLLQVRAGSSLVLLVPRDLSDETLTLATRRLRPAAVLSHPTREGILRHALGRLFASGPGGRGARVQHRPAQALLGVSAAMREVLENVRRVAGSNIPILILGETGTGKELVARAVHQQSGRSGGPFVALNCGALPETLLESELFGHQRGAFTGAERDRPGLFAQASGGTLFLDEVGDMPPAMQAKLLRALETQEIRPLGATATLRVDVRIVSATHHDIEARVKEGDFREDLFYRLNVATIHVPPLRRRRVDIPFLAQHFAEEFGAAHAREVVLAEDFVEALARRDFPGNVRELRSAVERAIALAAPDDPVTSDVLDSGAEESRPPSVRGTLRRQIEQLELRAIRAALDQHGGNKTRAAEALGLSRLGLRKKIRRLGLE